MGVPQSWRGRFLPIPSRSLDNIETMGNTGLVRPNGETRCQERSRVASSGPTSQQNWSRATSLTPVLPPISATAYLTPLREGGSLPGLMEADDLGTYVVKFTGAGQGPKALVAEIVVGELGRAARRRGPRSGADRGGSRRSAVGSRTRRCRSW